MSELKRYTADEIWSNQEYGGSLPRDSEFVLATDIPRPNDAKAIEREPIRVYKGAEITKRESELHPVLKNVIGFVSLENHQEVVKSLEGDITALWEKVERTEDERDALKKAIKEE